MEIVNSLLHIVTNFLHTFPSGMTTSSPIGQSSGMKEIMGHPRSGDASGKRVRLREDLQLKL